MMRAEWNPLEWMLHPVWHWIVLTIGWSLCLSLFLSLKRDIHTVAVLWAKKQRFLESSVEECRGAWKKKIDSVESQLKEAAERPHPPAIVPAGPPPTGLSFSKRSEALQMHRRGDAPDQIASAVGVPRNEIDLLLKIHRIVLSSY